MINIKCQAILFDLDGTLVDSTVCVERHWQEWANKHSLDAKEILKISHGRPTIDTIQLVAPHLDAETEAEALDKSQAKNLSGVVAVPGAIALLTSLPQNKWAIVTSGNRQIATNRLLHVGIPIPECLITTNDVEQYKPHPEGYLKAARHLSVAPDKCVVIEDAPVGLQAASAAGMKAIAVTTTYSISDLSMADVCISGLENISVKPPISEEPANWIELETQILDCK
ncbi:HAD family hydrolase [Myxosarcina sp. GI1]|uniref:HAD family hydrolase n=1 Tax=Myxosarcina sp. GI1 TaxID=1541065 RepID=UPI000690A137|nr:HAD family hydrolase [Myxosarcina sp. GI1]